MRLGTMQPYFFPYLGHFSLIAATDLWVVLDVTQYTPQSWMNRNRVLHPSAGWKWLTVPVRKNSMQARTSEIELVDPKAARRDTLNHLVHYKGAPYYGVIRNLVGDVFTDDPSLSRLNCRSLESVCRYLWIPFESRFCSALELPLPYNLGAGDWAREICVALGATTYVNPIGGRALFDPAQFRRAGVKLQFLDAVPFAYRSGQFPFEPSLSIIDVLMWNSPEIVREAVNTFDLITAECLEQAT